MISPVSFVIQMLKPVPFHIIAARCQGKINPRKFSQNLSTNIDICGKIVSKLV